MTITNMTKDDILKLKAATLYVLTQCGETDYVHLFKILYFAERHHYANFGKHLVPDVFCALERGPVPSFLYDSLKLASGFHTAPKDNSLWMITDAITPGGGECYYMVQAKEEPDMDELSKAEIESLNLSIKENLPKTSKQLSMDSHDEAWGKAWETRHASIIDPILIAKAGGASEGFMKYLKEQEDLNKLLAD